MSSVSPVARASELISRGRSVAMGLSIICILLFHQEFLSSDIFYPFRRCGYWGVEFFLFVSGFGIWFSLDKGRGKRGVAAFYRRRLMRVMPSAVLFGCCVAVGNALTDKTFIYGSLPYGLDYLACALGVHLWYIRAILLFYLVAPFVFPYIHRRGFFVLLCLLSLGLGLALSHIPVMLSPNMEKSVLWPLLRFPAFLLGMRVACLGGNAVSPRPLFSLGDIAVAMFAGTCSLAAALYLQANELYHLQYVVLLPFVVGVCLLCGALKGLARQFMLCAWCCAVAEWFGARSLEIYLVHLAVYYGVTKYYGEHGADAMLLALSIALVLACCLRGAVKLLLSRCTATES